MMTAYGGKKMFYNLEYWKHLHVRHQLDVMHIEKNVCESIYEHYSTFQERPKMVLSQGMILWT